MNEKFLKQINELKEEGKDLFYISKGDPRYFKLYIRNISYAEKLGYGYIKDYIFYPTKEIIIVNIFNETIDLVKKPVNFIPLKIFQ
jgi:hypothetical protein